MLQLERYAANQVRKDLERKMVFVGGPRQVGKTTLATRLLPKTATTYLNWDVGAHRSAILKGELGSSRLLVLDEVHKYRKWRNFLKGLYDAMASGTAPRRQVLVTGSARLDLYRFGGDSLQGRYHYLRLLPLSVAELRHGGQDGIEALFRYGGFPEPFLSASEPEARRWSREYRSRLIREDLRDLESVQDLGTLELLAERLPACVGSPLSLNALREDLEVAHRTVAKWVAILEKLYAVFRIPPMGSPKIRAVKKEQKAYLFDWTQVADEGARFENLVAVHLLKHAYWNEDTRGDAMELRYFRDTDGREVDFTLLKDGKPALFVECKLGDAEISPSLRYLHAKYPAVPAWQVHLRGKKDYQTPEGIRVGPAAPFLAGLT